MWVETAVGLHMVVLAVEAGESDKFAYSGSGVNLGVSWACVKGTARGAVGFIVHMGMYTGCASLGTREGRSS